MVEVLQQALENTIKNYNSRYQVVVREEEDRDIFVITMFAVVGVPAHGQVLLSARGEVEMDDMLNGDITADILNLLELLEVKLQQAIEKEPF